MDPFGDVQEDFRCRDDDVGPVGVQAECGDPLFDRQRFQFVVDGLQVGYVEPVVVLIAFEPVELVDVAARQMIFRS